MGPKGGPRFGCHLGTICSLLGRYLVPIWPLVGAALHHPAVIEDLLGTGECNATHLWEGMDIGELGSGRSQASLHSRKLTQKKRYSEFRRCSVRIRSLFGCCFYLFGRYLVAIWSLFGRYLIAIWSLFCHLDTIWSLLGRYLVPIWPLKGPPCTPRR